MKHDYFENITTERQAYLYGYICADGYNNQDRGVIQMTLAEKDIEILQKLSNAIDHNKKFTTISFPEKPNRQTLKMISICSKKMSADLASLGCKQRKSLTLQIPPLPDNLIRHFIRGYFDGDGCIYLKNRRDGALVIECPIVCSDIFASQLNCILFEKFGILTYCQKLGKNKVCTTLKISGRKNNSVFLPWLYEDCSIYLNRKYLIYLTFKSLCAKRTIYHPSTKIHRPYLS